MTRSLCVASLLSLLSGAGATDEFDCKGMRVKQLRTFLAERGVKCEGCAEKSDFLALCEEHKDTPVVEQPEPKEPEPPVGDGKGEKNIDDILSGLKGMPGMEGIKMFSGDDLKNMNYEQMGKQFGGGKRPRKTKSQYRRQLVDFYKRYDLPYAEEKIDTAMDKFKGKEEKMFDKLYQKYDAEIKAYNEKEDEKYKDTPETTEAADDTAEADAMADAAFGKMDKDEV